MVAAEYMILRYVASHAPELLDEAKDLIEEYISEHGDDLEDLFGFVISLLGLG